MERVTAGVARPDEGFGAGKGVFIIKKVKSNKKWIFGTPSKKYKNRLNRSEKKVSNENPRASLSQDPMGKVP